MQKTLNQILDCFFFFHFILPSISFSKRYLIFTVFNMWVNQVDCKINTIFVHLKFLEQYFDGNTVIDFITSGSQSGGRVQDEGHGMAN